MKRLICYLAFFLVAFSAERAFAQIVRASRNSLSAQPVLWLDNLVPTQLIALSIQFETSIAKSEALANRLVLFRNPLVGRASTSGYAFSSEYRRYFSTTTCGWHIGPFVEWIGYQYYDSSLNNLFDFGVVAGHKWQTDKLIFDISVRTSWYSPSSYPRGGYFPPFSGSNLNIMMIVSVGRSLD